MSMIIPKQSLANRSGNSEPVSGTVHYTALYAMSNEPVQCMAPAA